jgi:hypothetical protein
MTIGAADAYLPEAPFLSLLMTGKTGCCQVCPFEPEPAIVVLFYGKRKLFKPFCTVAHGTIRYHTIFCKLLVMIILMTVGAQAVLYW